MAENYQVIDVKKYKTYQDVSQVGNHNNRSVPTKNANPKKAHLNHFIVGGPTDDVGQIVEEKFQQLGIKPRKNANIVCGVVLSASHDFFYDTNGKLNKKNCAEFEKIAYKWAKIKFGKENIVQCVVHYDERSPHFQILFTPIHEGKLTSAHWFDGPAKLNRLHDSFAKVLKPLGLKRGIVGNKPTDREIEDYYRKVNVTAEEEKKIDDDLKILEEKFENPPLMYRLMPWKFVSEIVKPYLTQITENLKTYTAQAHHYRNEAGRAKKLQQKVNDYELKLETLGINPKISFIQCEKLQHVVRPAVAEYQATATTPAPATQPDLVEPGPTPKKPKEFKV